MSVLSVRVDELNNGDDKLKVLMLVTRCQAKSHIVTHEIAKVSKKHHYHLYINGPLTIKQVRNKFEYLFKTHKGSSYAIAKVKKEETFKSYILKDSNILSTSFTDKEIEEMKTWIPRSEYKKSVLTRLKDEIKDKALDDIAYSLCEYYDKQNMSFDKFRMKAYAYALYFHNNDKSINVKKEISRYIIEN